MIGEIFSMRIELSYLLPYDWPHARDFLASRAVAGVEQVDETRTRGSPPAPRSPSTRPRTRSRCMCAGRLAA
jgi:hypothetical protein